MMSSGVKPTKTSTLIGDVVFFRYAKYQPPVGEIKHIVFVWDIDKTYLNTNFSTLRGLIRTAFEKAFQKVNVPGTATLIRALKDKYSQNGFFPLYFVSASPPQIEETIFQKMQIDGISPLGMLLKNNLVNLRPKKFKFLKRQVGFKIQALFELLVHLNTPVSFLLFGDDSESDAVVYNLFSDICARRLPENHLLSILESLHVEKEQRDRIIQLQKLVPVFDPVDKIFINLINDTDPDYYAKFGRRTLATFTTFQAALDLYLSDYIDSKALILVGRDMLGNYGFTPEELAKSFEDLYKRGFVNPEKSAEILSTLKAGGVIPAHYQLPFQPVKAIQKLGTKIGERLLGIDTEDPWIPSSIDYLNDIR